MKKLNVPIMGALAALLVLAVGCGDGGDADVSVSQDELPVVAPGAGLVALNRFLEFEGQRYMLTLELHEGIVHEAEFRPIGDATASDIPLSDGNVVYAREGDADAVYTFTPATEDDGPIWLRWAKI